MNPLSPQDALSIVRQVAQAFQATGKEHYLIAQAINVLDQTVNAPKSEPAKP